MSYLATIQMASGPKVAANLSQIESLVRIAVEQKAKLILLPENFACIPLNDEEILDVAETQGSGIIQDFLANLAKQNKVWIVAGSVPIVCENTKKVKQALIVFNDQGDQMARYDKIHLFDVKIAESNESYTESAIIEEGNQVVVVDSPIGKLGLSICYDLRFPELYRQLVDKGAEILLVPSAFTKVTGFAHWESLLKARAIENVCYVAAAAQGGFHVNGRETYGHSMIIDPWGRILSQQNQGSGVVVSAIDLDYLNQIRTNFPVLSHRKL